VEEDEEYFHPPELKEPFYLPFHGNAPKLKWVKLWSVHIDWDGAVSMFKNLDELELAYHTKDVQPPWHAFSSYITNSPNITRLELKQSGPKFIDPFTVTPGESDEAYIWSRDPLEIPTLKDLVLCEHDPTYAYALVTKLHVPNLNFLSLDYVAEDYSDVVEALAQPFPGVSSQRSVFQTISGLEIDDLGSVRAHAFDAMLEAINGIKHISLTCDDDVFEDDEVTLDTFSVPRRVWEALSSNTKDVWTARNPGKSQTKKNTGTTANGPPSSASTVEDSAVPVVPTLRFPNLVGLRTCGISGESLRLFASRRKDLGVPLRQLSVHRNDDISRRDEEWFNENLEEFTYYSDQEETYEEDDDDDEDDEDEDDDDDDDNGDMGSDVDVDVVEDDGDDSWTTDSSEEDDDDDLDDIIINHF